MLDGLQFLPLNQTVQRTFTGKGMTMSKPKVTLKHANQIRKILKDEKLTKKQKATALVSVAGAAGYTVLLPIDFIPDALPFIGTADDASIWLGAFGVIVKIGLDQWAKIRESVALMNEDMGAMQHELNWYRFYYQYNRAPTEEDLVQFIADQQKNALE